MTPPAIDDVLAEHGAMLSRIAASVEADPVRRQDLLQEIALALWRALPAFRGEAGLRTFVARVAQNRAVDHVARHAGRAGLPLDETHVDEHGDPIDSADAVQRRGRLLAAIRRLPVGQRQAVVLALEGFSQREIAEALGVEENSIAQRLSRARRQLRAWLEPIA
ncbi:RNA polymerase sigma factor [Lysobacter humi (ex Lee et al. 2017)]